MNQHLRSLTVEAMLFLSCRRIFFTAMMASFVGTSGAMMAHNSASEPSNRRIDIVPLVAAHQHLMSPTGVALVLPEPPLTTITLPPDLDRLLPRREKVSGAPPTGDLFTEDAIIQELQEGRWPVRQGTSTDETLNFVLGLR